MSALLSVVALRDLIDSTVTILMDGPPADPADPATASRRLATEARRLLRAAEEALADELPPLTPGEFVKLMNTDTAARVEVENFCGRRWSMVNVTDLAREEDDTGDPSWEILHGSDRFQVREVPRYEARRTGGPGNVEGWYVHDNEDNEVCEPDGDVYAQAKVDPNTPVFSERDARELVACLNEREGEHGGAERWIVVDTNTTDDEDARNGGRYDVWRESGADYDPTDEDDARNAAEQANREDYAQNAYGWPFAHNYAAQIDEREGEDFDAAGFVVARHEPSGQVYAGIDGGGYSFTDAHWAPLYLRVLLHGRYAPSSIYVPTDAGLRRVVRA